MAQRVRSNRVASGQPSERLAAADPPIDFSESDPELLIAYLSRQIGRAAKQRERQERTRYRKAFGRWGDFAYGFARIGAEQRGVPLFDEPDKA